MTITMPPVLRAEMGAVDGSANGSGVAEAFRRKPAELRAADAQGKRMQDLVARLMAADEREVQGGYQAGHARGDQWARREARPK